MVLEVLADDINRYVDPWHRGPASITHDTLPVIRREEGWTFGHLLLGVFIVSIWLDDPLGILRWALRLLFG